MQSTHVLLLQQIISAQWKNIFGLPIMCVPTIGNPLQVTMTKYVKRPRAMFHIFWHYFDNMTKIRTWFPKAGENRNIFAYHCYAFSPGKIWRGSYKHTKNKNERKFKLGDERKQIAYVPKILNAFVRIAKCTSGFLTYLIIIVASVGNRNSVFCKLCPLNFPCRNMHFVRCIAKFRIKVITLIRNMTYLRQKKYWFLKEDVASDFKQNTVFR